jgi:2-polyprenyl-3-methyl-5-hydroxy-6-metoxy-1,4-benzoquinol methylase
MMKLTEGPLHCVCRGEHFRRVFAYTAPPESEVCFAFSSAQEYYREVLCCQLCGHFVSKHEMNDVALYQGDYVNSNYGADGIRQAFDRIVSLDPGKSDNIGRVDRILEFADHHFANGTFANRAPSVLDVGSGLCVFLHRMKEAGWNCTALDPDARAVAHARDEVGVNAVCGDFMKEQGLGRFDVVTFNKVLEHVEDPVAMLAKSMEHLGDGGFVYVELPDGEAALAEGPGREEFFIDHLHVFSCASLTLLVERAGFSVLTVDRLREPSTKYTLRAFLIPRAAAGRDAENEVRRILTDEQDAAWA